jgi:hypothetical protein
MTDSALARLPSTYLEDLAHIVLAARPDGTRFDPYPDLGDDVRSRLRSRLKQAGRYDWPSSLREDPGLRKGYTLHQCCRLLVVLLLIDTHLPPSLAIALARNNEMTFLRAIAARLAEHSRYDAALNDVMSVVLPGEVRDTLPADETDQGCRQQVFLVERGRMADMWAAPLCEAGARLVIDVSTATAAMWRWIASRRLMDDTVRLALIAEVDQAADQPGFRKLVEKVNRRV